MIATLAVMVGGLVLIVQLVRSPSPYSSGGLTSPTFVPTFSNYARTIKLKGEKQQVQWTSAVVDPTGTRVQVEFMGAVDKRCQPPVEVEIEAVNHNEAIVDLFEPMVPQGTCAEGSASFVTVGTVEPAISPTARLIHRPKSKSADESSKG